jgi:DNA-binding transcriptional LysR family regulator
MQLLVRNSKGIALTEAGEYFYAGLPEILQKYDHLRKDIIHISQKNNREIDLISAYGILRLLSPDCILDFKEKNPEVTLTYREFPDKQVERLFLNAKEGNVAFSI